MTSPAPEPLPALALFDPRQLLTVEEVVDRTRSSRSSLCEEMASGRLAYVKRGTTRRLLGADVNAFVGRFYRPCGR